MSWFTHPPTLKHPTVKTDVRKHYETKTTCSEFSSRNVGLNMSCRLRPRFDPSLSLWPREYAWPVALNSIHHTWRKSYHVPLLRLLFRLSVCLSVCVWRAGAESKYVRTLGMSYRIAVLPVTLWPWVVLKVISPILKIARFYVSRKIVHLRWRYRVPIFYDAERVLVCNIKFLVGY